MDVNASFAETLRNYRESARFSQDELAVKSGLDRTYISQLERGLKSPTLTTLALLAVALDLEPADFLKTRGRDKAAAPRLNADYLSRAVDNLTLRRGNQTVAVPARPFLFAIDRTHQLIDQMYSMELDVASVLGLRNLSAFIGELVAAAILKGADNLFRKNPHQDGYPDLLLMDGIGKRQWDRFEGRHDEKSPFSNFEGGGIEVKATVGSVPSPASCRKRGANRPELGDTRISCITGYDWKAHHRETNNLLGVFWDFVQRRPRIAALFYSSALTTADWGRIVQPREGGGRTTSVSIMQRSGIRKMYEGWLCVLKSGGYVEFLNRKNASSLIPTSGQTKVPPPSSQ